MQTRRLAPLMLSCLCFLLLVSPTWGGKGPSLAQLRQAIINNPQDPEANYKLGLKYEELGRPQEALKYLQEAAKSSPTSPGPLNNLGDRPSYRQATARRPLRPSRRPCVAIPRISRPL